MRILDIHPTVFFVREETGLRQAVDLTLGMDGQKPPAAHVAWSVPGERGDFVVPLAWQEGSDAATARAFVPDMREPGTVEFRLLDEEAVADAHSVAWQPAPHWDVYLVPGSHHDLGYTDLPSNILREHDRFLDDVVRFCDETADWPEETRYRYVVEQGWSVLHYLQHRPPAQVERLVKLMREGRVEVTALLGNMTSEMCGPEEQIRLTYPSFRLKRRYGIPIQTAELNDVPGLSWGLVSVLAGAGVRYFAPYIPDYYAWGFKVHPFWDEKEVLPRNLPGGFWWEGPDKSRILLWYAHRLSHQTELWSYEQGVTTLGDRLADATQRGYPLDMIRLRVQGGRRDNAPPDMRFSRIAREWNSHWAYPRLIMSTNIQFFERLDAKYGHTLRTLRGELPNTDYVIGAASTAKETGANRLTHETILSAEKLAACASLVAGYEYPAETLAEANDCMALYDEHTWGMAHPFGPAQDACWSQKAEYAYRAAALAHDVLSKSSNRIADNVQLTDEGYHLVVFNPLATARTELVRAPFIEAAPCGRPMRWTQPADGDPQPPMMVNGTAIGRNIVDLPGSLLAVPFELVDLSSGRSIPYQITTISDPLAAQPEAAQRCALSGPDQLAERQLIMDPAHMKQLVFVAEDVPALGFKIFRIVPVAEKPVLPTSIVTGAHSLENRFYRITLDAESGAVVSIVDKESDRELVDRGAQFGVNQVIARSPASGSVTAAARSTITKGEAGAVLGSLVVRGEASGCPQRTQEITVYDTIKRIDFANRLLRDATPQLELYIAFPLAAQAPQFRFEGINSVMEPVRDQLPGSNTDAYAIQHWLAMWDKAGGIAWSSLEAPSVALSELWPASVSQAHHGLTAPGYGHDFLRDPAQLTQGHIYSYVMYNNFRTNFQPVQVADALFRYSLTSYEGDWQQGQAADFGWSASTSLVPVCVSGPQQGALPPATSFCHMDQENIRLLTIKAAEDGDGLILRLCETEGRDTRVTVTLPFLDIDRTVAANLVEEDERALAHEHHTVTLDVRAHGIATVRCRSSRRWPQAVEFAYN